MWLARFERIILIEGSEWASSPACMHACIHARQQAGESAATSGLARVDSSEVVTTSIDATRRLEQRKELKPIPDHAAADFVHKDRLGQASFVSRGEKFVS